jgi:hypothetical protein
MKKLFLLAAVVALFAAEAPAQVTKPVGLAIRAGLDFPASGYGRDKGRTWFGFGGEFKLMDSKFGTMQPGYSGVITLSADYYGKGAASATPILLNYVASQNEFFYSGGVGLAITRDEVPAGGGGLRGRNANNFGYQVGIGYNFQSGQNPLFVEAKYFGNGNSKLNVFGLYLGLRL